MGFQKQIVIILFCLFFFTACHVVTQEELDPTNRLAPDPLFIKERKVAILPLEIESQDISDYAVSWVSVIENQLYYYLQFIDSMPMDKETITLKNWGDLLLFYGILDPKELNQDAKYEYLIKTVKDNYQYWMRVSPEYQKELEKRYELPTQFHTSVEKTKASWDSLVKDHALVIQTKMDNKALRLRVYDTISSKDIIIVEKPLPNFKEGLDHTKALDQVLKSVVKETIAKIKDQDPTEIYIDQQNTDKNTTVFIDNKLVQTDSIFLVPKDYPIFFSHDGLIVKKGTIKVTKESSRINTAWEDIKKDWKTLTINTEPNYASLFINEQFVGHSPLNIDLPLGNHYIRASLMGYNHINYLLKVTDNMPNSSINLNFVIQNELFKKQLKMVNELKNTSFYISIFSGIMALVAYEQLSFYLEKTQISSSYVSRMNQFTIITSVFGGVSITFGLVSLIAQIVEYQMKDQGFGIDSDGRLGMNIRF